MSTITLTDRAAGQTILDTFFNDIHSAMNGDFVGRNSSGVATSGQNLGTTALPWGTVRANAIVVNGQSLDPDLAGSPQNVITSGAVRSTSNQPGFLDPNGAALSIVIDATPTSLVFDVNGTSVTASSDVTISSLTAAPSSNNTCLVDDATAADQADTRLWGEPWHRKTITVDTMGSEISGLIGKFAAFMLDNATTTEYFIAYVASATELKWARRGYFYDSSINPKNRIVFSNNDTITLLKWGHVFLEDNGTTADVSYTVPAYSFDQPSSPVTGDYWYDLGNLTWRRYDGASFAIIDRTYLGSFVNTTTACVGARCEPFYGRYSRLNSMEVDLSTTAIAVGGQFGKVNVAGNDYDFGLTQANWNMTTDLAGSTDMYDATEQASRFYYFYIKDTGDRVISDIEPYFRRELNGTWYHPHNPWRCVGIGYNNASSNLTVVESWGRVQAKTVRLSNPNGHGGTNNKIRRWSTEVENTSASLFYQEESSNVAMTLTVKEPCLVSCYYQDYSSSGGRLGISRNSNQLTTSLASITNEHWIASFVAGAVGNNEFGCAFNQWALIGDVYRAHGDGSQDGTDGRGRMSFTKTKCWGEE